MLALLLAFILFLGYPNPYRYEASVSVQGSPDFVEAMEQSLDLLAQDDTLSWWLAWASLHDVTIRQSTVPALFSPNAAMTAHGNIKTIVVHPLGQYLPAATTAVAIVHELRHLMNYPDIDECKAYTDTYLAATLLDQPALLPWVEGQLDYYYCQAP